MFNNKKDPLLDQITDIMGKSKIAEEVERNLCEDLGIVSKKALPFEYHTLYENTLKERVNEALHPNQQKLDVHEPEKNKLTAQDFTKIRAMSKKKKPIDEGKWNYPKDMTKSKETSDMGTTNASQNRKDRKDLRKSIKAKAHQERMKEDTIEEGNKENKAKKNAAMEKKGEDAINSGTPAFRRFRKSESPVESKRVGRFLTKYGTRRDALQKAKEKMPMEEEVEQLDELSKKTLGSYVKQASDDVTNLHRRSAKYTAAGPYWREYADKLYAKSSQRRGNVNKAVDKLTKEEVEQLDELSKGTLGRYIKKAKEDIRDRDRENSYTAAELGHGSRATAALKIPRAKAHNRSKNIDKAVDKLTKEEVERLDEVSAEKLGRYIKKASKDRDDTMVAAFDANKNLFANEKIQKDNIKRWSKRTDGIRLATNKLAGDTNVDLRSMYRPRVSANEETRLDELSAEKLGRYIKKASANRETAQNDYNDGVRKFDRNDPRQKSALKKISKRTDGIRRAANRLARHPNPDLRYAWLKHGTHSYGLEEQETNLDEKCWKGYEMFGTKNKNGKKVPNCVPKEEVEQLDEISKKKALSAYQSASFVDGEHPKQDKIRGHIERKWGKEMGKNADVHAYVSNYGRGKSSSTTDKLANVLDKTKSGRVTKSGTMNKQDQKYNATAIKKRLGTHKKPNLPEEVEQLNELSKKKVKDYISKNFKDIHKYDDDTEENNRKVHNRSKGLERALDKRDGNSRVKVPAKKEKSSAYFDSDNNFREDPKARSRRGLNEISKKKILTRESSGESVESAKVPGKGSSTKDVKYYLTHENIGNHDGNVAGSSYYVLHKPKDTVKDLKKAGWNHKPGGRDESDEYRHPDGHTTIKHKSGSNELKVTYKGTEKPPKPKPYMTYDESVEHNTKETKKTFPNVKYLTKDGHPDWAKHGIDPKTINHNNYWKKVGDLKNSAKNEETHLDEVAPSGAKFERMIKHIKKGYAKDGLSKNEKSIAYATAWKAKNKEEKKNLSEDEFGNVPIYTPKPVAKPAPVAPEGAIPPRPGQAGNSVTPGRPEPKSPEGAIPPRPGQAGNSPAPVSSVASVAAKMPEPPEPVKSPTSQDIARQSLRAPVAAAKGEGQTGSALAQSGVSRQDRMNQDFVNRTLGAGAAKAGSAAANLALKRHFDGLRNASNANAPATPAPRPVTNTPMRATPAPRPVSNAPMPPRRPVMSASPRLNESMEHTIRNMLESKKD